MPKNKNRGQLADEYGLCPKTFRKRLREYDIVLPQGAVFPPYQKLIYETFDYPDTVERESYREVKLPKEYQH